MNITDKQYEDLLVAGNHLASFLINHGILPNNYSTYEQALENNGIDYADVWVGWKAIMGIRVWE